MNFAIQRNFVRKNSGNDGLHEKSGEIHSVASIITKGMSSKNTHHALKESNSKRRFRNSLLSPKMVDKHITSKEHILSNDGTAFSKKVSKTNIAFKDKEMEQMSDEVDMTLRLKKANE